MFTSCPECGTIFRISSGELRLAEGFVRCGHCSATFNAVNSLTDEPPPTVTLRQLELPPEAETSMAAAERRAEPRVLPGFPDEPEALPAAPELNAAATYVPLPVSEDTLEFDVPEAGWSHFFDAEEVEPAPDLPDEEPVTGDEPAPEEEPEPELGVFRALAPEDEWQSLLGEVSDEETQNPVYAVSDPPLDAPAPADSSVGEQAVDRPFVWEPPAGPASEPRHWGYTAGAIALAALLLIQLLHQQRDALAALPTLTAPLSRLYDSLGLPLYPDWDLRAYEVRGSEAVAGRTHQGALDIVARLAVVGNDPVGLPLMQVTLRDRLGKPLGARVFAAKDYLEPGTARPHEPLAPGTQVPVQLSLRDPGADASGYDVDVCLMRRSSGLECQAEREPFVR